MVHDEATYELTTRLTDAALDHGEAVCDSETAVGDLEILLCAALSQLTPEQWTAFWEDTQVRDIVAEIPEYAAIAREVYPGFVDDTSECEP